MYCELGGGVCGEIDTLGNEKETGGICEGINADWVAQNKIVCMWLQMGVIGRGKGCHDNLSCVRPWCSLRCEEISHRVWNVGARGMFGGTDWLCRHPSGPHTIPALAL